MKRMICLLFISVLLLTGCTPASSGNSGSSGSGGKTTFTVGMECNYAPFNWTQMEANETAVQLEDGSYCDGYDVVIARRIADALGYELVIKAIAWEGLEPALSSGEIDAIIAGMTANDERRKNHDFTTPYYESEMVMLVRNDSDYVTATSLADFSGARIIGQLNTTYDEVIDQIPGVIHEVPLQSYSAMVVALINGEVDGITAEMPVAVGTTSANPSLTYVRFTDGGFDVDTTTSIAVQKGNTELLNAIQGVIDGISVEERNQLMLEATQRQPAVEE